MSSYVFLIILNILKMLFGVSFLAWSTVHSVCFLYLYGHVFPYLGKFFSMILL